MLTREQFETTYGPVSDVAYALYIETRAECSTLREQVITLMAQINELQAAPAALDEQVATLTAQIKELQDRLNKDSHNSNKPPSTDGLKKKNKPVTLRSKSGKKSGGQRGHPGRCLKFSDK